MYYFLFVYLSYIIYCFTCKTESFNKKNINSSIEESFAKYRHVIEAAHAANMKVRG